MRSLVASARRALSSGDLPEADRLVTRLLDDYSGAAASHGLALELLIKRGELDEAGRVADRLEERFPDSAGVLFQTGMAAFRLKRYPAALRRFEESHKIYPAPKTRRWRAKTLTNMGRFDDAEALLVDLVEKDPNCRLDLAWLYERKGERERAIRQNARHLERFPTDRLALSQQTRLAAGELDEAEVIEQVQVLDELGEAIPEELISRYVSALVASGRSEEARRFITDEHPKLNRRTLTDLAWTCHRLQLHDMAYELFVLILEHRLSDFKLLNTLDFSARRARIADSARSR